ncbi:hypothetical protein Tco_0607279, partial [Tanacetum coccineum]
VAEAIRLRAHVAGIEDAKKIADLQSSVSAKDLELDGFNASVTSLESQNDNLVDQ